jgi:hypothetical protein
MNTFKRFHSSKNGEKLKTTGRMARLIIPVPAVLFALTLIFTARAQNHAPAIFDLTPPAGAVANCLPNAVARVLVFPKEQRLGVDSLDLKAEGLPANTTFNVFLTQLPGAPFGAVEYIGNFDTNSDGRGSLRVDTIVNDAFASTVVAGVRVRNDLNHVVIWFADPAADDFCFAPGTGPITPFDADGQAGASALSSANSLPGAPLP